MPRRAAPRTPDRCACSPALSPVPRAFRVAASTSRPHWRPPAAAPSEAPPRPGQAPPVAASPSCRADWRGRWPLCERVRITSERTQHEASPTRDKMTPGDTFAASWSSSRVRPPNDSKTSAIDLAVAALPSQATTSPDGRSSDLEDGVEGLSSGRVAHHHGDQQRKPQRLILRGSPQHAPASRDSQSTASWARPAHRLQTSCSAKGIGL
jgi:hypothetical protein